MYATKRTVAIAAMLGLGVPGLGVNWAHAQGLAEFSTMVLNIQCFTPSAPAEDQGADCSKYDGLNRTLRITFYNAQNPQLFQETRLQSFNFNSIRAYLDGNGDPNTFAVIYAGTNSILTDLGLRLKVEVLSSNGTYGPLLDVPYRPEGYSLWALHSKDTVGLQSQITTLQSTTNDEAVNRKSADAALESLLTGGDAATLASANGYTDAHVASEASQRTNADALLQSSINDEAANRKSADAALSAIDNTLQSTVEGLGSMIVIEESSRAAADTALRNNIAAIYSGDLTLGAANVIGILALPISKVVGIFGYLIDAPNGFLAGDVPVLAPSGLAFVPSSHAAIHAETITAGLVASTAGGAAIIATGSDSDGLFGECSVTVNDWAPIQAGVHGKGDGFATGVRGESANGPGVVGTSTAATGVHGTGFTGVAGYAVDDGRAGGAGVVAQSSSTAGSRALVAEAMGDGTLAASFIGAVKVEGPVNITPAGLDTPLKVGAVSACTDYNGVPFCRKSTSATFDGPIVVQRDGDPTFGSIDGATGTSAFFVGTVNVGGDLNVAGAKHFRIDHPLDPGGKYLVHTSVESPDMKNIYDGLATLDAKGEAVITLPSYFEALNRDFRYQLTAVGAAAPGLHVAAKVSGNRFRIAGGAPGLEVSWQVTGIRHDAYAEAHTAAVEQAKAERERGRYLYPEGFGRPRDQVIAGR